MKIHIVQKGDTLWKIAKQYNVDFEQLKRLNTQLSNPEMIMPGMKIKIPSQSSPAKHENTPIGQNAGMPPLKAMPSPQIETPEQAVTPEVPLKAMPTVPVPVIEPDDLKPGVSVQPQMPNYEAPKYELPKYEAPKYAVPKYEAPKYEVPKYEAPKYQMPKYEAPKYEAPKYEVPKFEAPKYEAPKFEAPPIYQQPKIEFDMIQNQIYQQAQQQAQPVPVQQPCPEKPAQPQIQILPVYFYPIMPPVQHVQPPVQPQPPSLCEPINFECGPCGTTHGHSHHMGHHGGFMHHGGGQPWQQSWGLHGDPNAAFYSHDMMNLNPNPVLYRDDSEEQQPNGPDSINQNYEQLAPEFAADQRESQDSTYYESMPRYFDDQNLYSPHSLRYEESEQDDSENSFDSANPSENPEQL